MSGILFDTEGPLEDPDKIKPPESCWKYCPKLQPRELWTLAVFFGDSKMIWGGAAREFLSNVVEVPGLGCTITPGVVQFNAVFGAQCKHYWLEFQRSVETKTEQIEFPSCYSDDLVKWWNQAFGGYECKATGGRFRIGCMRPQINEEECQTYGCPFDCPGDNCYINNRKCNYDSCGVGQTRQNNYNWFNFRYDSTNEDVKEKDPLGLVKKTADRLKISPKFFAEYYEKYSGFGVNWHRKLIERVDAEWNPGTNKGNQVLKHHTTNRKHPFTDPWECYKCNPEDNPSDAIGFSFDAIYLTGAALIYGAATGDVGYKDACSKSHHDKGWFGHMDWRRFAPDMGIHGGTAEPSMILVNSPSECVYESTVRAHFVDHAQCPNEDSLEHFINSERYGDYFECNCYIVKDNDYNTRRCCTEDEAQDLQNTNSHKQVLFDENDGSVDGIQLWSFSSDEYDYSQEPLPQKEQDEGKHHCPVGQNIKELAEKPEKYAELFDELGSIHDDSVPDVMGEISMCTLSYPFPYRDRSGNQKCCATTVFLARDGTQACLGDINFNAGMIGQEQLTCPHLLHWVLKNVTKHPCKPNICGTGTKNLDGGLVEYYITNGTKSSDPVVFMSSDSETTNVMHLIEDINTLIAREVGVPVAKGQSAPNADSKTVDFDDSSKKFLESALSRNAPSRRSLDAEISDYGKCAFSVYPRTCDPKGKKSFVMDIPPVPISGVVDRYKKDAAGTGSLEDYFVQFGVPREVKFYTYQRPDPVAPSPTVSPTTAPTSSPTLSPTTSPTLAADFVPAISLTSPYAMSLYQQKAKCYRIAMTGAGDTGCTDAVKEMPESTSITNEKNCNDLTLTKAKAVEIDSTVDECPSFVRFMWSHKKPRIGPGVLENHRDKTNLEMCFLAETRIPIQAAQKCPTKLCVEFNPAFIDASTEMCEDCTEKCNTEDPLSLYLAKLNNPPECHCRCSSRLFSRDLCSAKSLRIISNIADEANILGITVKSSILGSIPPDQFPDGLVITSANPLIHTRINRALGPGSVRTKGCNVLKITTPDITLSNIELDNTDCQEEALMELGNPNPEDDSTDGTIRDAFLNLKGWDMSPVRITNPLKTIGPTNITLHNVKLSAATNFRKIFPGRPLISVDNNANANARPVNISGLKLSQINDTHRYRDNRDEVNNPFPLAPLHMIMWHFTGNVTYHVINRARFFALFCFVLFCFLF